MSEHQHPVIMCDGADEDLGCPVGAVELDHTLGGLVKITTPDGWPLSQLPPGWTGPTPGDDRTGLLPHRCPDCTQAFAHSPAGCTCSKAAGVCEAETDDGCTYCRTADPELPCPNLDPEPAP